MVEVESGEFPEQRFQTAVALYITSQPFVDQGQVLGTVPIATSISARSSGSLPNASSMVAMVSTIRTRTARCRYAEAKILQRMLLNEYVTKPNDVDGTKTRPFLYALSVLQCLISTMAWMDEGFV